MKLLLLIPEFYNLKTNFYTLKKPQKTTTTKTPKKQQQQKNQTKNQTNEKRQKMLLLTAVQSQKPKIKNGNTLPDKI